MPPFAKVKLLKKIIALCFLSTIAPAAAAEASRWDLNDVSYLLPLGRLVQGTHPSDLTKGQRENFIPSGIHSELVKSFDAADQARVRDFYSRWSLVGLRIDPCFREHFTDACQKQVRAIWQPLLAGATAPTAEDFALHTFYPVGDSEWNRLKSDFAALKTRTRESPATSTLGKPLMVHPGFSGPNAPAFAREFVRRVKPWIAQSRLSSIAVTLPSDGGRKSVFKRFFVFPDAVFRLSPQWISYGAELEIRYGNESDRGPRTQDFSEAAPATLKPLTSQDDLRPLLKDSRRLRNDRASLPHFAEVVLRTSNPLKHASLTIDCLSCHASGAARQWLDQNLTAQEKSALREDEFKNPGNYNLRNISRADTGPTRFRAFGYVGTDPQLLDRVIFESALVAESFNKK